MTKMKVGRFLIAATLLGAVGCHRMDVGSVTAKLRIGMSKVELDQVMKGERFLKEQVVRNWPGKSEAETRAAIISNSIIKLISPEDLIRERLPFDGSVKAYSYLIRENRRFANPTNVEALFVFVDSKVGKVVGWADMDGLVEVRLWDDFF